MIEIFNCETTFEQAIALPENLKVFSEAAKELGADRISAQLNDFYSRRNELTSEEKASAKDRVLNTAKRFGKERFAQIASKYVKDAKALPSYIEEAIKWIVE